MLGTKTKELANIGFFPIQYCDFEKLGNFFAKKPKIQLNLLFKKFQNFLNFLGKKGGWEDLNIIRNIVMERCNEFGKVIKKAC